MNFYPTSTERFTIPDDYQDKHFSPEHYLRKKYEVMEQYIRECGITALVVAISGGIDSAVVGKMMEHLAKKIGIGFFPITLPAISISGVSNQYDTIALAKKQFPDCTIIHIGDVVDNCHNSLPHFSTAWAQGQSVAYMRTAAMYSYTSQLSDQNLRPVIVGTTNQSEGRYIGYFGKASDGMVDLQPISDIFKSEVYILAKYLGVIDEIVNRAPNGDMHDNRTDEEVFGFTYDELEYVLLQMNEHGFSSPLQVADHPAMHNMLNLHQYNKHKYFGASPAVHFDLEHYVVSFPGSWKTFNSQFMSFTPFLE